MVVLVRLLLGLIVIAALASSAGASSRLTVQIGFFVLMAALVGVALWAHRNE